MQLLNSKETQFWSPFLKVVLQGIRSKLKNWTPSTTGSICTINNLCLQYPRLHLIKENHTLPTKTDLPSCGYKHPKQFSRPMPQLPSIDLHGHDKGKLNQNRWPQMSGVTFGVWLESHLMTSGRFHSTKLLRSKSSLIVMAHGSLFWCYD